MFTGDFFDSNLKQDWDIHFSDSSAPGYFNLQQVNRDGFNFTIDGGTSNGKGVIASFSTINGGNTGILGTANCHMSETRDFTIYIFPVESWYEAKRIICPDIFANGGQFPHLSIKRSSVFTKTVVVPYISGPEADHSLFSCKDF